MKSFENTSDKTFTFSSCAVCDAKCCKGSHGTIFSQIVLEDFAQVYSHFPILFLQGNLGFLKPVVLLTNGKNDCRYLFNNQCTIYEKRPSVCQIYPLSPHLTNEIFIDTLCPAVNDGAKIIVSNNQVEKEFAHIGLEQYKEKYIKMHFHLNAWNKKENLKVFTKIKESVFYAFKEDFGDDFIKMHLSSLKHFDEYFTS